MDEIELKRDELRNQGADAFWRSMTNYLKSIAISLIALVVYFTFGTGTLFLCKIAQSNLLPDAINCAPYSDVPSLPKATINLFTTNEGMSQKIEFDGGSNSSSDFLKSLAEPTNFFSKWVYSMVLPAIILNYKAVNTVFDGLNQAPEWVAVLFGPLVWIFVYFGMVLATTFYVPFLWIFNLGELFAYEEVGDEWTYWSTLLAPGRLTLAIILGISALFAAVPFGLLLGIYASFRALFSFLFYTATPVDPPDGEPTKPVTFLALLPETFRHFKLLFMGILSAMILQSTFKELGPSAGIFAIVTLVIIYFGILPSSMFQQMDAHPEFGKLSPVTSTLQAERNCPGQAQQTGGYGGYRGPGASAISPAAVSSSSSSNKFTMFGGQRQVMKHLRELNRRLR